MKTIIILLFAFLFTQPTRSQTYLGASYNRLLDGSNSNGASVEYMGSQWGVQLCITDRAVYYERGYDWSSFYIITQHGKTSIGYLPSGPQAVVNVLYYIPIAGQFSIGAMAGAGEQQQTGIEQVETAPGVIYYGPTVRNEQRNTFVWNVGAGIRYNLTNVVFLMDYGLRTGAGIGFALSL